MPVIRTGRVDQDAGLRSRLQADPPFLRPRSLDTRANVRAALQQNRVPWNNIVNRVLDRLPRRLVRAIVIIRSAGGRRCTPGPDCLPRLENLVSVNPPPRLP